MSSTSTNKQPLLIDRPLIEVEVLTTAAVGDRNRDTYRVQGGQGPVLLVDMDRTLTDDDISGGVIDTIEIVRNESAPDADLFIKASGIASPTTYITGKIVNAEEDFFVPQLTLSQSTPAIVDALIVGGVASTVVTLASGNLVHIPSGIPPAVSLTTTNSGTLININQFDYLHVTQAGVVANPGSTLPSGVGVYQYINPTPVSNAPANITYTIASGYRFLGTAPGTAFLGSGYYLYGGAGVTGHGAVLTYTTPSGFTRLGTEEVYYKYPATINTNDILNVTTTAFVNNITQIPSAAGVYQYTGSTVITERPDLISFTPSNGFVFIGANLGSYSNGAGFYQYTDTASVAFFDRATPLTEANGFAYLGETLNESFEEIEVCFYHVRQKVNPVANDGDYKFLGSVVLGVNDTRVDGLGILPHSSAPVPHITGDLRVDIPGRNRALYLQRGDALYTGIFAKTGTSVNYEPGVTILAQGGYY